MTNDSRNDDNLPRSVSGPEEGRAIDDSRSGYYGAVQYVFLGADYLGAGTVAVTVQNTDTSRIILDR